MWNDFKRLKKLEERVDELEHKVRLQALEYTELYDKVRSIIGKWAKRIERYQADAEEPSGAEEQTSGESSLTSRQQQINDQILTRRKRVTNAVLPR